MTTATSSYTDDVRGPGLLARIAGFFANRRLGDALSVKARMKAWRRDRDLNELYVKLDGLTDAQLAVIGFDRQALAVDLAELYDRREKAVEEIEAMTADLAGPIPVERRLAA